MPDKTTIAKTDELQPGQGMVADVAGREIAVFNVGGTFYALNNTCAHRGGPLGEGDLEGEVVTCPWHGWQFNVTTGACVNNPSACVTAFPAVVEGNEVKVDL